MEKLLGVFETAEEALAAAEKAQKELVTNYSTEQRQAMIDSMKKMGMEHLEELSHMELDETGYGRYEDKLQKNGGSFSKTQGIEALTHEVLASSAGLTVDYYAPYGLVGAVTPCTNPSSTIFANGICNLAAGNAVVFNAHPAAKKSCAYACHLANQAIVEAGGPANLLTMPAEPTMETLDVIMKYPTVKLLLGTGGPGMVKTLMSSGKKVIAAGPGNPPCVVDETADIKKVAAGLTMGASFDNNLLCIAEKEVFVVDSVFDELIKEMVALGNRLLTPEEAAIANEKCTIETPNGGRATNKKYVGKNAAVILKDLGIPVEGDPRLAILEAKNEDNLVQTEQMMPVLPLVRCKDFDEAVERAVAAEHGNWHSSAIWTARLDRATKLGKMINTTVFAMNAPTLAAFGICGTGTNSPTIATPTGEGVTSPRSFARRRRFAMGDGLGYVL